MENPQVSEKRSLRIFNAILSLLSVESNDGSRSRGHDLRSA